MTARIPAMPTEDDMLQMKTALIVKRNTTRDYLDFVEIATQMGDGRFARVMEGCRSARVRLESCGRRRRALGGRDRGPRTRRCA